MALKDADSRECGRHVLLLGYSRIARKRLIPALETFGQTIHLDIASKSAARAARAEQRLPGDIFDSYNAALQKSRAAIVYISLVNSDHARWAEKALASGRHVVVDKPAFLSCADAERLLALAKDKKLLLAEANVFSFHPQIEYVLEAFLSAKSAPAKITAVFSFPGFQKADFRYKAGCGGGALNDLGPYAISAGTIFFKEHPWKLFCQVTDRSREGVDLAFSMAALYTGGRAMVGHFGFNTEYQNTISLLGPSLCISFDRVFTIRSDYKNTLALRTSYKIKEISVPQSDCFANFFKQIFSAVKSCVFKEQYEHVLQQAKSLEMLKAAAQKEDCI
jgi:dTDP-3,4-didehydro-2,6-dideoxy-alpha-D-glucose 3-reductase